MKKESQRLQVYVPLEIPSIDLATAAGLRLLADVVETAEKSGQFTSITVAEDDPLSFYGVRLETEEEAKTRRNQEKRAEAARKAKDRRDAARIAAILAQNPGVEFDSAGPIARTMKFASHSQPKSEVRQTLSASMTEPVKRSLVAGQEALNLSGYFYLKGSSTLVPYAELVMPQ